MLMLPVTSEWDIIGTLHAEYLGYGELKAISRDYGGATCKQCLMRRQML